MRGDDSSLLGSRVDPRIQVGVELGARLSGEGPGSERPGEHTGLGSQLDSGTSPGGPGTCPFRKVFVVRNCCGVSIAVSFVALTI